MSAERGTAALLLVGGPCGTVSGTAPSSHSSPPGAVCDRPRCDVQPSASSPVPQLRTEDLSSAQDGAGAAVSRQITALTVDFWNTLFGNANGARRDRDRRAALTAELEVVGFSVEQERLTSAARGAMTFFEHHWLANRRTPGPRELVGVMVDELGVQLPDAALDRVATTFAEGVLEHPPNLLPGAREALESLHGHVRFALISDTAFSPGRVLRELMEREGIACFFSGFVFSDETGAAKPEPAAFHGALEQLGVGAAEAAHIGDIERTDIRGARTVGMQAILYRNEQHRHVLAEDTTEADTVVEHWSQVAELLRAASSRASVRRSGAALDPVSLRGGGAEGARCGQGLG